MNHVKRNHVAIWSFLMVLIVLFFNILVYKKIVEMSFFNIPMVALLFIIGNKKFRYDWANKYRNPIAIVVAVVTLLAYSLILPQISPVDVMKKMTEIYDENNYSVEIIGYSASDREHIFVKGAYFVKVENEVDGNVDSYMFDSSTGDFTVVY
ncbi:MULTISPECIES: hypothetical protein [unclassified Fusibacter]|uniref:hypothetical protein n=1 Tax=unclassified Fusibacter TaxID=2624464 RepID=UPI0010136DB7|nr:MULTISPECIES: hypothetical protein [unclassified Fusibacter]MCK8058223.1 hypothetical protein [Fusibacter sp. A2]NPE20806.1 hypothetical protein [Fusibacter sp. A1]RXV63010.1 hypothetical protein DWB64_03155 [Fusibacter sp. A1]